MTNQNNAAQAATQHPIDEAIVILTEEAAALSDCHTRPIGDWTGEDEAKARYDYIQTVIAALSKLRAPVAGEPAFYINSSLIDAGTGRIRAEIRDPLTWSDTPVGNWMTPVFIAPGAGEAQPAAYLTLDEEGSPCMLFFDVVEASGYCAPGEEPKPLFRHAASQASAEYAIMASGDVAQLVAFIFDRFGQPGDAGALPDNVAAAVRRLERGIQPQAYKDGGQQRAGDDDALRFIAGTIYLNLNGPQDAAAVMAAARSIKEWFDGHHRAALSATQPEQGEA